MHLCEHIHPYPISPTFFPWKTGCQFDQSPILEMFQTLIQKRKSQRLEESWGSKGVNGNMLDIKKRENDKKMC